jgi:hypothetical protein
MASFVLALFIILLAMLGLGIGVLAGRPPLAGGCGRKPCSGCRRTVRQRCRSEQDAKP